MVARILMEKSLRQGQRQAGEQDTRQVAGQHACQGGREPSVRVTLEDMFEDMTPGGRCRVILVAEEQIALQSRLYALGLYPGVVVEVLRAAPFGDPLQIKVGSTLLSVRRREARLISVESV